MKIFIFVVVLLGVSCGIWARQICCPGLRCYDDGPPFVGLPLPQCPEDMGVNMQVYTRRNPKDGQYITRDIIPPNFNGELMTMFIVHGWLESENYTWMHQMKDAALAKEDYNVIIVGWKLGAANMFYPQPASNIRTLGGEIALVVNNTISKGKSSKALLYCVGHSFGAHTCGQAGQQGTQFGRITGLDPAGPLFVDRDRSAGLNPSCADLVDVIHTDSLLGLFTAVGHIDFYPNGGHNQPGCPLESLEMLYDWQNFTLINSDTELSTFQRIIACSHLRAYEFFTESIGTPCFLSHQSCYSPYVSPLFCTLSSTAVQSMGFYAAAYPGRGIFYLRTNPHQPFCLG